MKRRNRVFTLRTFAGPLRTFAILFSLLFFVTSLALAFQIDSTVNRTKLSLDDQLIFTVEVSGSETQNLPMPNLPSSFNGFTVLAGPQRQSSVQIVNFKMTASATYQYYLAATKKGKFTLPAVTVEFSGRKYSSKPIAVEVVARGSVQSADRNGRPTGQQGEQQDANVSFYRYEVSTKNPYVGQQVSLEYVLYTREQLADLGFKSLPKLTGLWVEDIEMKQIEQTRTTIEGVPYNRLVLKRQVLFPTSAGIITIEATALQLQVRYQAQREQRRRSMFDDFFGSDPFFGGRTKTKYVNSRPVEIKVSSLPPFTGDGEFSGLVGDFSISATLNKKEVKAGDSVTLTVTISGKGNVQAIQEPTMPSFDGVKLYSPTVNKSSRNRNGNVSGKKVFEYILVPSEQGALSVPEIPLNYFSPSAKDYKFKSTRPLNMVVTKGDMEFESPMILAASSGEKSEVTLIGQDINFIKLSQDPITNQGEILISKAWFWILQVLPVMLIVAVLVSKKRRETMARDVAGTRFKRAMQGARKYLKEASTALNQNNSSEFFSTLDKGVRTYLADKLNISAAGITTDQVRTLLEEKEVDSEIIDRIIQILEQCDFARFAPSAQSSDDMKQLLEEARQTLASLERAKIKK